MIDNGFVSGNARVRESGRGRQPDGSGASVFDFHHHGRQSLARTEERTGVSLLQRTTRRQRLTEFGTAYYERCTEVLGLVAESEQLAEQAHGDPTGTLRITAPLTFGSEVLAPALVEFSRRFPEVRLDLVLTNQRLDMIDNGFDVAIRLGNIPESSPLIARPLQDYTLTICAAPDYLARHGTPTHRGSS